MATHSVTAADPGCASLGTVGTPEVTVDESTAGLEALAPATVDLPEQVWFRTTDGGVVQPAVDIRHSRRPGLRERSCRPGWLAHRRSSRLSGGPRRRCLRRRRRSDGDRPRRPLLHHGLGTTVHFRPDDGLPPVDGRALAELIRSTSPWPQSAVEIDDARPTAGPVQGFRTGRSTALGRACRAHARVPGPRRECGQKYLAPGGVGVTSRKTGQSST